MAPRWCHRAAHAAGRPVAVHCLTREALILLLIALDDAGPLPGDRVEHAALVPAELMPEADLVVLRTRLADVPADPEPVRAVLMGGRLVWDRPGAEIAGW